MKIASIANTLILVKGVEMKDDPIMQKIVRNNIAQGGFKLVVKGNIKSTPEIEEYLEELRQKIMEESSVNEMFLKGRLLDER